MITITNSIFDAQGASNKDSKTPGITLSGVEDVVIKGCTFKNKGYSGILNHCAGNVEIDECKFECDNIYNPIEGSQIVSNGNVTVKNCEFTGTPGNNFVNFYQFKEDSIHEIIGCTFTPTCDNNIVRISNRTNAKANFLIKDCAYNFTSGTPSDYTGFLLCQDYTNKSGTKQNFSCVKMTLDNVTCDGVKVTEEGVVKGSIFYVYEDGKGIITDNNPVMVVK